MPQIKSQWIRAAAIGDVPMGEAKAVRLGEERSIALFNVDGRIYATDNQCPHMGYPLTRGAVRHGILTCDWHGRSFDLSDASSEDMALRTVLDSIEMVQVREVGRHTREYLNAGFSGDRLLSEMGQSILKDDNGWNFVHGLRVVFDEWKLCEEHPARNQLLIGLSRWATDVRKRAGNQSAAQTAQRFARGQTAVDL